MLKKKTMGNLWTQYFQEHKQKEIYGQNNDRSTNEGKSCEEILQGVQIMGKFVTKYSREHQ